MKKIAILGSTGSIGTQTLDVVRNNGDIRVVGISAGHNIDKAEEQVREFHPELAVIYDEKAAEDLKARIRDTDTRVLSGMDGLLELAVMPDSDILVTAIVGMIGIRPTLAAIEAGKDIALANKETLVTAGHLIMPLAKEKGVQILPVDSEHSAIFQCLHGEDRRQVHKLLITASGGPFRGRKTAELADIRPEDALKHPTWSMGRKITIDSATLVNKGLEVMEARWLFGVPLEQIQVVVQPQSIIHSMVEFEDGAVMAQLGSPDMRLPIQYALYYPERRYLPGERLDFTKLRSIEIDEPDMDTFRGLPLAIRAAKEGGSTPTVFNASNEEAVALFLDHRIGFLDIYRIIEEAMDRHRNIESPDLGQILAVEAETRRRISEEWK
ncbi:MAG: 1-deoxy-D-xylulose-5-phosphate reductoisomerase [Bilifractor sp.]|nr:1-deoxy-D-xylulose-5-phosphate reductoisomerase [Lachnospiraceae bacterium]MDY2836816.1 1-deoxy-D-xylulose-5-phosphate reductoisomerase [Bilifractor sp.]